MTRPLRIEFEDACYHVIARGNERRQIFRDPDDYERFIRIVARAKKKYRFYLYAYVLMENHYHLLVETPRPNLQKIMHMINCSYACYFNRKNERSGHLFQGRYTSVIVQVDTHLLTLCAYIHLNPVRAGIVSDPTHYRWSSLTDFLAGKRTTLTETDRVLRLFGPRKDKAVKAFLDFISGQVGSNPDWSDEVIGKAILGDNEFAESLLQRFCDPSMPKEIRDSRKMESVVLRNRVLRAINTYYGIKTHQLSDNEIATREARRMAVYMLKARTGLRLCEIGSIFGISYKGVYYHWRKVSEELATDADLRRTVEAIEKTIQLET